MAHALNAARPGLELSYIGGVRGLERRLVATSGFAYHELLVRSLRTAGRLDVHLVLDPVRLVVSAPQAWTLLGRLRPAALFTTGGYLSVPLVAAAAARRIPTLVWEGNVIPGRATRAVGRVATRVAVSFPPALAAFPGRSFVSGTPIRSFAGIDRGRARQALRVAEADRLLLVFGGSQAVTRLNSALLAALPDVLPAWRVLHLAGEAGIRAAFERRDDLPAGLRERYQVEPFLTDSMAAALVAADLVVGRAGSSTCAELAAVGVASVLVPYPYAGAHQRANAAWLAEQGAAVVIADAELDGVRLAGEIQRLTDDSRRAEMAAAARRLGRPHAAAHIAEELLALAEGRPPARDPAPSPV